MRSYHQYCSVARALDVIGDRWTLLIVRELLALEACRYTDLRAGLPGIATNLLATRLRELEAAGLVEREEAPPPIATTLFKLTPRGQALKPVIDELGRWGVPLMREAKDEDVFKAHWLQLPVEVFLSDRSPDDPSIHIQINAGDERAHLEVSDGSIRLRTGVFPQPDAQVSGTPQLVLALLSGAVTLGDAVTRGLVLGGARSALERVLPIRAAVASPGERT